MFQPDITAVGGSLTATALIAAIPLVTLFVLLGALRLAAWIAGLAALGVSLVIAIAAYSMPVDQALLVASWGAVFGFFPILWIVINAIWVYNLTVETGHFDVLRRSFATISDDMRVQAIIIAFCFGALLEALAGFGTPVAISSVMLIALGFKPLKAATLALVANTAPVAFGALAIPVVTLSSVTTAVVPEDQRDDFSVENLGALIGHQTPVLALFVPLILVFIIDGMRGVRQTWLPAIVCGGAFAVAQWLTATYFSVQLTDIVAALAGALATVLLVRVWSPSEHYTEGGEEQETGGTERSATSSGGERTQSAGTTTATTTGADDTPHDSPAEIFKAYAPYLVIIVIFSIVQIPAIKEALAAEPFTYLFAWPGLDLVSASGAEPPPFTFNWLGAAGTLMIIAGLVTMPIIGVSPARAMAAYAKTWAQLATAIVTVMAVLALAYVMNNSGQTASLGNWMAEAGKAFAILSPVLGWLGVAVTGSDTSANSLFGALQVTAAQGAGLDPALMAASNSSGGVLGKMISPQNLAIAAAAVGMAGREGDLFRKVVGWSLGLLVVMCLLVWLQTNVLEWMLP
ncbi:MAG TPA: L-lactate permease [Nocardioidaceae bacterium]|jgi:lactate permease|nr:L-lactate permease [Nocardioidaceae bacterium]